MPEYQTKLESVSILDTTFKIYSLKDKNQFDDPNGEADQLGISSSLWPVSCLVWPSGLVLAKIVNNLELDGLRILELGCGIAVASLVAASKGADITASDFHPLVKLFLDKNSKINELKPIKFITGNWNHPISNDGKFDLIIGSDLLYERRHGEILSRFIDCHLNPGGKIIIVDPGRRFSRKIIPMMRALGFKHDLKRLNPEAEEIKNGYFSQHTFYK